MKRGRSTRVELQTAAQGLPTARVLLPASPLCERCVCCRLSGSCHVKCVQKQPKQTGLVSATLTCGGTAGTSAQLFGFRRSQPCKPIALTAHPVEAFQVLAEYRICRYAVLQTPELKVEFYRSPFQETINHPFSHSVHIGLQELLDFVPELDVVGLFLKTVSLVRFDHEIIKFSALFQSFCERGCRRNRDLLV